MCSEKASLCKRLSMRMFRTCYSWFCKRFFCSSSWTLGSRIFSFLLLLNYRNMLVFFWLCDCFKKLLLLTFYVFTNSYLFDDVKKGEKYNNFDEPKEMQKLIIIIKWYKMCIYHWRVFVCLMINQGTLNKFTRHSKTGQNERTLLKFLRTDCSYNRRCTLCEHMFKNQIDPILFRSWELSES